MKIRAIYLPDIAFNDTKNIIFEFNKDTNSFILIGDESYRYDIECIIEDSNWILFETQLMEDVLDDNTIINCGITNQISKEDFIKRKDELN